ncbi:MAG: ABC transporter permease [Clostridia bacterium]|nr:ABC transporter permease [Clostridia bacterium]
MKFGQFNQLFHLTKRNIKLYFKDKLTFFLSLITPLILVVLFLTFLKSVYEDSLLMSLPEGFTISDNILNAFTGSWLFSSIMAVSCVTVAFCSNMMITDKISKSANDFYVSPIKRSTVSTSYFISNFITTLIVCFVVLIVSLIYLAIVGWYITFVDIIMIIFNIILCVLFGTLLSSFVGLFVSSQGGLSAISTLVSSMYGFICGAYMPIASFGEGMKAFVGFIPGTYGTILFRQFYMNGVLNEMAKTLPIEVIESIKTGFDYNFSFFNNQVETWVMFFILGLTIVAIFTLFVVFSNLQNKKHLTKKVKIKN